MSRGDDSCADNPESRGTFGTFRFFLRALQPRGNQTVHSGVARRRPDLLWRDRRHECFPGKITTLAYNEAMDRAQQATEPSIKVGYLEQAKDWLERLERAGLKEK